MSPSAGPLKALLRSNAAHYKSVKCPNNMKHELWIEEDESQIFCLAGPHGESARGLLGEGAKLIWLCEAESHFEAMQKYYAYMGWGEYKSDFPVHDKETYISRGWK